MSLWMIKLKRSIAMTLRLWYARSAATCRRQGKISFKHGGEFLQDWIRLTRRKSTPELVEEKLLRNCSKRALGVIDVPRRNDFFFQPRPANGREMNVRVHVFHTRPGPSCFNTNLLSAFMSVQATKSPHAYHDDIVQWQWGQAGLLVLLFLNEE